MRTIIKFVSAAIISSFLFIRCGNDNTTTTKEESKDSLASQSSNAAKEKMDKSMENDLMHPMTSMMKRMKSVTMTGDFDIDFASMMIEHHKAAVELSQQELKSGKDEKLKAMAQNIISSQNQEIDKLKDFVKNYKPSGMKHGEGELQKSMGNMETKMKDHTMTGDADKDFANMMISHHKQAVAMSEKELSNGMSDVLKKMAQKTISEQNREIKEFKDWLSSKN